MGLREFFNVMMGNNQELMRKHYKNRITGAMGICFPYLGEFQPTKYREKILCWMELFWTLGIIVLPCKKFLNSCLSDSKRTSI